LENKNYEFCVKALYDKYESFFLNKKQAKDVLNLSESTFDKYISLGKAPVSFQENGKVLYTIFDMAEYITKEKGLSSLEVEDLLTKNP